MKIIKLLKLRFAVWLFTRNLGKLSRRFSRLSQQTEKAAFLMENFGKEWSRALDDA